MNLFNKKMVENYKINFKRSIMDSVVGIGSVCLNFDFNFKLKDFMIRKLLRR